MLAHGVVEWKLVVVTGRISCRVEVEARTNLGSWLLGSQTLCCGGAQTAPQAPKEGAGGALSMIAWQAVDKKTGSHYLCSTQATIVVAGTTEVSFCTTSRSSDRSLLTLAPPTLS